MKRVVLIHWKPEEAGDLTRSLERAGWEVEVIAPNGLSEIRAISGRGPAALLIDLSRLPAQGRDVGVILRRQSETRRIPLAFVGGPSEKVERIRRLLPDAAFSSPAKIGQELARIIESNPLSPVSPDSNFAAYAETPLVRKLGIRPSAVLGMINAPEGFESQLSPLPEGVTVVRETGASVDLLIWFCGDFAELQGGFEPSSRLVRTGGAMWIAWPKKASRRKTDLTQTVVREFGLAMNWVDYKICAIDKTWSGLLFTRRKQE